VAEADLMRRVLTEAEFTRWLRDFLPSLPTDGRGGWLTPGVVTDPTDPKLGHLYGLNLSRAWMLDAIARSLPASDPRGAALTAAARIHSTAGMAGVTGEHYEVATGWAHSPCTSKRAVVCRFRARDDSAAALWFIGAARLVMPAIAETEQTCRTGCAQRELPESLRESRRPRRLRVGDSNGAAHLPAGRLASSSQVR
jgi:hypothetical protein